MLDRAFNDHSYQQFIREEFIMGSRCRTCGALSLPPRPFCVSCFNQDQEWVRFRGVGTLAAFTSIVVAPPTMAKEGFGRNNPYVVGIVDLEEGPRIVGRIIRLDPQKPDGIRIGSPLQAEFIHTGEAPHRKTYLAFKPRELG
ncbi:MAG: hypothetical protein A4E73_00717 [Syntrophaceae bacterium PtaU1.Bin231]|nr:MAG: hypothetical protein A4E73_00717 [Syntrophaceae bacterium PtaU1.Bin231]